MKKLFAIALFATTGAYAANWLPMYTSADDLYLYSINVDNVTHESGDVGFWLAESNIDKNAPFDTRIAYVKATCSKKTYRAEDEKTYLRGKEVKTYHSFIGKNNDEAKDGTVIHGLIVGVCKKKYEDYEPRNFKDVNELTKVTQKLLREEQKRIQKQKGSPF